MVKKKFNISYSTVKRLIKSIDDRHREAFIRQEYNYGDVCEFDWGTVKLAIGEKGYEPYQMAVFTPAKSNYRYAMLFKSQDTAAFQQSHAEFFSHCKGNYKTMVYDNMKVAVKKFVGLHEKEPTKALTEMSIYYGFNFRFANIARGNEKGHVEKSVEFEEIINTIIPKIFDYLKSIYINFLNLNDEIVDKFISGTSFDIALLISNSINYNYYDSLYLQCYENIDLYDEQITINNITEEINGTKIKYNVIEILINAFVDVAQSTFKYETSSEEEKLMLDFFKKSASLFHINNPVIVEISNEISKAIEEFLFRDIITGVIKKLVYGLNRLGQEKTFEYIKDLLDNKKYLD